MPDFSWIPTYTALADALLPYKNDRQALIAKLKSACTACNQKFPTLERDGSTKDIDPFTVFATFNNGKKTENCTALIGALLKAFGREDIPLPTGFDGVPRVMAQKANFFAFEYTTEDMEELWALFSAALAFADAPGDALAAAQVAELYDKVQKHKGIKWNVTMGLFWVRPNTFINLDGVNRSFLKTSGIATVEKLPMGQEYLALCSDVREALANDGEYHGFPELSHAAFLAGGEDEPAAPPTGVQYWLYAPGENAAFWDEFYEKGIAAIGWSELGDLSAYADRDAVVAAVKEAYNLKNKPTHSALALWQFSRIMRPGDVIFAKRGSQQIVGCGIVTGEYVYDETVGGRYYHTRRVSWTHSVEWDVDLGNTKTLTLLAPGEKLEQLKALFATEPPTTPPTAPAAAPTKHAPYGKAEFLEDVYMSEEGFDDLMALLSEKRNVVLQGAPGTGKTYAARRLAYAMMNEHAPERVVTLQFHQSYSYEDFVMGYRPNGAGGFDRVAGPFYQICKAAESDPDHDYFLIIDEINRGNLSKIFGELFMLLEADKRGKDSLRLLYADEEFSIPERLYVIGTMNTADRSIALVDYALRRRFAFFDMEPAFSHSRFCEGFEKGTPLAALCEAVKALNRDIASDPSLGSGFRIGHSYFCKLEGTDKARLSRIVTYEIFPLLREYWIDEPSRAEEWYARLQAAVESKL